MPCNRAKASGGVCAPSCCDHAVCSGKGGKQDYTDEIIKNAILNGIYDHKIKRLILATEKIYDKDIDKIVKSVQLHERAFSSTSESNTPTVTPNAGCQSGGERTGTQIRGCFVFSTPPF